MNCQHKAVVPEKYAGPSDLFNLYGVGPAWKGRKHEISKMFHRDLDAVVRSPTPADIEQAKKNIQDGIDTLDQIEKELEQTRAKLANLKQRREAVQQDIQLNRSITSNLRTIPDEILSLIFEYYVESDPQASPWVLMSVCHQWRAAAVLARRIWLKIMVTHAVPSPQRLHKRLNERSSLGYEICHTVPLLEKALDRAAGVPLHLSFKFGDSRYSGVYGDADVISRQLLKTLKDRKVCLRIYELETKSTSTDWIKNVDFDGFEFPGLEKAWLTTSSKSLNERIKKTSSRLRWLNIEKNSDDVLDWDLSTRMPCLVHLWLSESGHDVPCRPETLKMLQNPPRLTVLKLWHVKLEPLPGDGSLSIPSLLTLEFYSAEIGCKLDLPSLRELIVDISRLPISETSPLVFPSLTSLVIKNCHYESLPDIRAPGPLMLDILTFQPPQSTLVKIMDDMIVLGHLSLRSLCLDTLDIRAELLSEFLNKVPNLEELEIRGTMLSPTTFSTDLVGHSLTAKTNLVNKDPFCKSLQTFKIGSSSLSSSDGGNIMRWFELAIKLRNKGRYPIKEASYWDGEAWVSVV